MAFIIKDELFETETRYDQPEILIGKNYGSEIQLKDKGIRSRHAIIRYNTDRKHFEVAAGEPKAVVKLGGRSLGVTPEVIKKTETVQIGRFRIKLEPEDADLIVSVSRPRGLRDQRESASLGKSDSISEAVYAEDFFYDDGLAKRRRIKNKLMWTLGLVFAAVTLVTIAVAPNERVYPGPTKVEDSATQLLKVHQLLPAKCLTDEGRKEKECDRFISPFTRPGEMSVLVFAQDYHAKGCDSCHSSALSNAASSESCTLCHLPTVVTSATNKEADCFSCHFEHKVFDHAPRIEAGRRLLPIRLAQLAGSDGAKEQANQSSSGEPEEDQGADLDGGVGEQSPGKGKQKQPSWYQKLLRAINQWLPTNYTFDENTPRWVNKSCMDCHNDGISKIVHKDMPKYIQTPAWEMKFGHEIHTINEPRCAYCHEPGQMTQRAQTLNNCFDCHKDPVVDGQGEYCIGCHNYHHSTEMSKADIISKYPDFDKRRFKFVFPPEPLPGRRMIKLSEAIQPNDSDGSDELNQPSESGELGESGETDEPNGPNE